jgi:hypothetical protein
VLPDALVIDGRTPVRPDPSIAELADLLHDRLIGELRIEAEADAADWRTLLLLLSRTAEELMADGGIGKLWMSSGNRISTFARSTMRKSSASAVAVMPPRGSASSSSAAGR